MREILFRGFHENKSGESVILVNGAEKRGTWVEGSLIKSESGHCYIGEWLVSSKAIQFYCGGSRKHRTETRYLGMGFALVIPETVGQFTGILACEEKKVFEGDRIKADEEGEISEYSIAYCGEDDYPAFDCIPHIDCDANGLSYLKGADYPIEVIGTIFDTPDKPKGATHD
ncbi:hypothetical protein SDC9_74206 [bioreactor metagenome]|uniref:YopX protein domain-containing protein n=1 Tax=bioreactor metagenome TaxID=1076179 RepID=A0A644YMH8_9ZZZZ